MDVDVCFAAEVVVVAPATPDVVVTCVDVVTVDDDEDDDEASTVVPVSTGFEVAGAVPVPVVVPGVVPEGAAAELGVGATVTGLDVQPRPMSRSSPVVKVRTRLRRIIHFSPPVMVRKASAAGHRRRVGRPAVRPISTTGVSSL